MGDVAAADNLGSVLALTGFQNHWCWVPRAGSGRGRAAGPSSPFLFPHGTLSASKFGSGMPGHFSSLGREMAQSSEIGKN